MTTRTTNGELTDQILHLEIGSGGQRRVGTALFDDFLHQLSGRKALAVYEEMGANDSDIASLLFSLSMIARETDWHAEPADDTPQAQAAADFLEENVQGLRDPFADVVANAMAPTLQYGWSFQELTYKRDPTPMWDHFDVRPQTSFLTWILDEKNRPLGFTQQQQKGVLPIPLAKGIYFRTDTTKPEGRSALRAAYRSWWFKKRSEENLMIGVERNLNGLPVVTVPGPILIEGPGTEMYDMLKNIVTRTKKDEQMGIMFPSDVYPETSIPMYSFDLISPDGDPHFEQVIQVIRLWAVNMLSSVLAQWQGLGRDAPGSRALADPLQELFLVAINAILDQLEETINRGVVRQLFRVQPSSPDVLPRLVHEDVEKVDVKALSESWKNLFQSGATYSEEQYEQMKERVGLDREDELGQVAKSWPHAG